VDSVTVGIGGMEVRGAQSRGLYEFGRPHELDSGDLEYAVEMAADVRLEHDRTLLHVLPQHFTLDGRGGIRRPQKSVCSRLEAHVHIVDRRRARASGVDCRRAPGAPGSGRDRV
jgi:cell division ATPase FtsA